MGLITVIYGDKGLLDRVGSASQLTWDLEHQIRSLLDTLTKGGGSTLGKV